MPLFDRRNFLGFGPALFTSFAIGGRQGDDKLRIDHSVEVDSAFLDVYSHWLRHESVEPERYLAQFGGVETCKEWVGGVVCNDFAIGNIYLLDGVVASKTEVALLAFWGKVSVLRGRVF